MRFLCCVSRTLPCLDARGVLVPLLCLLSCSFVLSCSFLSCVCFSLCYVCSFPAAWRGVAWRGSGSCSVRRTSGRWPWYDSWRPACTSEVRRGEGEREEREGRDWTCLRYNLLLSSPRRVFDTCCKRCRPGAWRVRAPSVAWYGNGFMTSRGVLVLSGCRFVSYFYLSYRLSSLTPETTYEKYTFMSLQTGVAGFFLQDPR